MADRPIECSDCKRPININYTEINGTKIHTTSCCSECPFIKEKIQSTSRIPESTQQPFSRTLSCSMCQTSSEGVLRGETLGCAKCYEVFATLVINMLTESDALSIQPQETEKTENKIVSLHLGLVPENMCDNAEQLTEKLENLNCALGEALALENYEEAAHIRDQIQELTKRRHAG